MFHRMKCANTSVMTVVCATVVFASATLVFASDKSLVQSHRKALPKTEWKMKSELVKSERHPTQFHQLTFSSKKETYIYSPERPPLGMVSDEKVVISGQTYFLTGWAKGSATILYRVFAPSMAKQKPICEMTSQSEEAKLRIQDGKLQISIVITNEDDEKSEAAWVECGLEAKEVDANEA